MTEWLDKPSKKKQKREHHSVNWILVKRLFFEGVVIKDIAQEIGVGVTTIRDRSVRENWQAEKNQLNTILKTDVLMEMKDSVLVWQKRIRAMTEKQLTHLETMSSNLTSDATKKNLDKHYKFAETLQLVNNMARKNLQMDDKDNRNPHVNINIMSGHNDVVGRKETPAGTLDV